jgi:molybdate transport system ATP-binding protein
MSEAGLCADFSVQRSFEVQASFFIAPGEKLSLLGPSGSGKSTILGALAGLVPIKRGIVVLDGRVLSRVEPGRLGRPRKSRVPLRSRSMSLVAQEPALFPHMTVLANVAYGARRFSRESAMKMVEAFGLSELTGRRPGELSGGQRARVSLARALARPPRAVLLDEPLSSLDHLARRELLDLMTEVIASLDVPSILVTHELFEAQRFGDRLGLLDRGRVVQLGDPSEVVARPATRRAAELVGYREFLDVSLPGSLRGARYSIGVHPSRVALVSGGANLGPMERLDALRGKSFVLEGTVAGLWPEGAGLAVSVRPDAFPGAKLTCSMPFATLGLREGSRCRLALVDPPVFDSLGRVCQSGAIQAELQKQFAMLAESVREIRVQ